MALKPFYQNMQAWIDQGCPANNYFGFSTKNGLCTNLRAWAYRQNKSCGSFTAEMKETFLEAKLDAKYPFNLGNERMYTLESIYSNMYGNSQRLAWIKERAQ